MMKPQCPTVKGQNFEHDFTSSYRAVGPNMHVDGAHGIRTARDD